MVKDDTVKIIKRNGVTLEKETFAKIISFMLLGKKCYVKEIETGEQYIVDTCDIENVSNKNLE